MGNMFPGLPGGMPMGSFENGSSFIHSDTAGGKVGMYIWQALLNHVC